VYFFSIIRVALKNVQQEYDNRLTGMLTGTRGQWRRLHGARVPTVTNGWARGAS